MKKVIVFSLTYYPNDVGGAEVAIKEITDRIESEEYEFHMVCLRYDRTLPKQEKIGNIHIHRIGFTTVNPTIQDLGKFPMRMNKHLFLFLAPLVAWRLNRTYNFHASWAMMAHPCAIPQVLFQKFTGLPSILTLQEGDTPEYIKKLYGPLYGLFSQAFTRASVIQVISRYLGDWARSMGYKKDIVFIPNGASVQSAIMQFTENELQELRDQIDYHSEQVIISGPYSRLSSKNAIDDVIRALPMLDEQVRLLVVGDGDDKPMLIQLAVELGVSDRVTFMGHVDRTMTAKIRRISDIFIRPSRSEGFGISLVSTMAARLPLISTHVGGIPDFLFDARRNPDKPSTGWVVGTDSPEQIAQTIKHILHNPEEVTQTIENAYQMAMTIYNWEYIAQNMKKQVFDTVMNK